MISLEINNTLDFGIVLTIAGILVLYFGRLIVKARRELSRDNLSEAMTGAFFVADLIIIPSLIIYAIYIILTQFLVPKIMGNPFPYGALFIFVMSSVFIIIQYYIFKHYRAKIDKSVKTDRGMNIFVGVILVAFTLILYLFSSLYFFSICLVMNALILTFIACRDHYRDKKILDGKLLEIKLSSESKPLRAKIFRMGDDFITFTTENKEEIIISKSDILSVKVVS